MRKSFYCCAALSALAALAGCQKTEPAMGLDDNDAIGFAPYVSRDVTKASVTDVTASNLTSFNVACYQTGSATSYFTSEQSASKNAAGYWETNDTYYWPTSGKLDFFAYCGSGSGSVSNTGGVAKVSYTVPDAATEDFIVASAIGQGKPSASPYAQSLSFSHALSKVSQLTLAPVTGSASADSKYRYVVTDVRIAGAKNSADYTFNPASGSNWGAASGSQDYAFEDIDFNFLGSSSHKLEVAADVNDQLIVLPQTATFSVTYSVECSADGGTTWTEIMASATKTADVEMDPGKAYSVKLQLPNDASPIIFSTNVAGWGDAVEVDKEIESEKPLLPGKFSVSENKKVKFTNGNLYWNGGEFHLESSQTAYPHVWDTSHVGHFYWSQTASVAYAETYSDPSVTSSDKFFCGEDNKFTVDGQSGLYALSSSEWFYLINTRAEANRYAKARVNDVNGLIIFPDEYNGGAVLSGVTGVAEVNTSGASFPTDNVSNWSSMEGAGCLFLPAAGYRNGSVLSDVGSAGYCWSTTPNGTDFALYLLFGIGYLDCACNDFHSSGKIVRLACAVQ